MTTNRVLTINIAVQSRVHYSVNFVSLDKDNFTKIWKTFTSQLQGKGEICTAREKEALDDYCEEIKKDKELMRRFTGRGIRTLFTTAQLLDYPRISKQNLANVVIAAKNFRGELQDIARKVQNLESAGED